ncbi:sugar ABC transporter substrate-binding protein [Conexibacter sp. CPCC 206217]|uniref:sugar ABC transporter substrate-binding protein n=1 Tax=Conexibacter sp. CPCC 206217 TaxID=3064574 RepID=UPI0027189E88|nr:sugar ABC transporter substrate-binding protein [Conexibacter sp. CPCC 206217]MDO8212067.1 sugar ABC transporter substrate-binding protein [Conexibacter sp. CPCC 206217]
MRTNRRTPRALASACLVALLAALVLAGCGSSDDSTSSSSSAGSTAASTTASQPAADVPFESPEAGLPTSYPEPTVRPGFRYTVGYLSPNSSIGFLASVYKGVKEQTERFGGKFIGYDANFNQDKQVSQFADLLAQHPDVIVAYPLLPSALAARVREAQAAGIPIVTNDTPPDASLPLEPGYDTNVHQGLDIARYRIAQAVARESPGATYALLGQSLPVPSLRYAMDRSHYWGDRFGNRFVGEVDAADDTPNAGQQAMTALLAKYPDVDYVIAYNDTAAEAASAVARSSGKTDVKIVGDGGDATAVRMIKSGQLWGTYGPDERGIGVQQAIAAYDLATRQHLPLPRNIVITSGTMVTRDNVDDYTPANDA